MSTSGNHLIATSHEPRATISRKNALPKQHESAVISQTEDSILRNVQGENLGENKSKNLTAGLDFAIRLITYLELIADEISIGLR